jgi:WD40 repeat protein
MARTQIKQTGLEPSIVASITEGSSPKITAIQITDNTYTLLDDTAVSLDGGYIRITGSGFGPGCQVLINNTPVSSISFVNSTTVHAQVPAAAAGTYVVYLVNTNGGVAIAVNGLTYSALPDWVTGTSLGESPAGSAISLQLSATSATTYVLTSGSTLPPGLTLSSGGLLSGTVTGVTVTTLYNFSVTAIDAELQDSPRTFSITIRLLATFIGLAHFTTPFVTVYPWDSSTGFGSKVTNPVTLATGNGYDIDFTAAGNAVAISHSASPYVTAYPWTSNGFGSKYANPAVLPDANNGQAQGISFSPNDNAIAVAHSAQPSVGKTQVSAYQWNSSTGFGSKYSNPATTTGIVDAGITSIRFSKNGQSLAAGGNTVPYINIYQFTAVSGFGTKYSNPGTQPTNAVYGIMFSPNDSYVATAHFGSPFISVYPWNASTGFGTRIANPSTLPGGTGQSVDFHPTGASIALGHDEAPAVSVYPWSSGGFGTKYSNPATFGSNYVNGVRFTPDGSALALATDYFGTHVPTVFPWNNTTGFGTRYTYPTAAAGSLRKVAFVQS